MWLDNPSLDPQEMLAQAEKLREYDWLEKHLKEIKKQLENNPSPEILASAERFLSALRAKKVEFESQKWIVSDEVQIKIKNLKEELELWNEIQERLDVVRILQDIDAPKELNLNWINLKSALICLSKVTSKWDFETWRKAWYEPDGLFDSWELSRLNKLNEEYDSNVWLKNRIIAAIDKYKLWWTTNAQVEKPKDETVIIKDDKNTKQVKFDDKNNKNNPQQKSSNNWENLYEVVDEKEEDLKLPLNEAKQIEQILWVNLDKVNYKSLFSMINLLSVVPPIENKDELKRLWYKPTWLGWMISDSEFEQAKSFQEVSRNQDKKVILNWLMYYYSNWATSKDYLKDKLLSEKINEKNVYNVFSSRDANSINRWQLWAILKSSKNEANTVKALVKIINISRPEKLQEVSTKKDLVQLIKNDPSIIMSFYKWLDTLAYSSTDISRYIKSGWDMTKDYEAFEKWSKKLEVVLDKHFEEKFPEAIAKAKKELQSSTTISEADKQKQLAIIENLESKDKQSFKDFFKLKSIWILASFVETKKWGGWSIIIWNNSENEIIKMIDIEIWLFATQDWKFYPSVWLWISWEKDFTDTIKWSARAWVNIFWVYVLAWIDKQINAEDLKNAQFKDFEWKTKRVWIYWNAWFWFAWWLTYWAWLYYKESRKEWIEKKAKQLESVIEKFNSINSVSDIDKIDLQNPEQNESKLASEDEKLIKFELKRILEALWFDSTNSPERKIQIFNLMKRSKINDFYQAATLKAQDEWWNWSWIAGWIQFIGWFFPVPVFWISFSKVTEDKKDDKFKKYRDATIEFGNAEDISNYDKLINEIKESLDIDIKFDNEKKLFVIEGYDDSMWMIKNAWDKFVKINYNQEVAKNIQIDWTKILIGNIWSIFARSRKLKNWELLTINLGWSKENIKAWDSKNFNTAVVDNLLVTNNTKTEEKLWWLNIERSKRSYSDFLDKNKNTITRWLSIYKSPKWNAYIDMRKWLDSWDLELARKWLGAYLIAHDKKESKTAVDYINSIKDNSELAYIIADFKDILMVDQYVRHLSWLTPKQKEDLMKDYKKNPSKYKYLNSYDILKTPYLWDKSLDRTRAFQGMARKFFPQDSENLIKVREDVANKYKTSWDAGWTSESRNNIFALVGSYKIWKDAEWKTHSAWRWFDAMPPWVVSVADGKTYEFTPANKAELINIFASKKIYFDNMKNSILDSINSKLSASNKIDKKDFTEEKFKEILEKWSTQVNGTKISIESKFVFFLYWRCFNESVWIEFGNISVEKGWATLQAPITFSSFDSVDQSISRPQETVAAIWAWLWEKRPTNTWDDIWVSSTPGERVSSSWANGWWWAPSTQTWWWRNP